MRLVFKCRRRPSSACRHLLPVNGEKGDGRNVRNILAAALIAPRLCTELVQLTATDMKYIEDGFARIRVQGARLSEPMLSMIDVGAKLGTSSDGGHGNSPLP